jgi:thioester reductase-like protein
VSTEPTGDAPAEGETAAQPAAEPPKPRRAPARAPQVALVTGFPAFTARRMLEKVLDADARVRAYLLVREKFRQEADEYLAHLPAKSRRRVRPLAGDVCDIDLGLSGAEYRELASELTTIVHCAAAYYLGVPREMALRVNVDGTRNVLELAGACARLERLCHFSTAFVSGDRKGVIMEEELDARQRFRNAYEETKFRAELLVREAAHRLPVVVMRPGIIVGDSRTGVIDRLDGPYHLIRLIVSSPLDVALPLPGRGGAPLHLVPVDFVVDAAYALMHDPRAIGLTFHLTDPCPLAARRAYELVAERANRKPPKGSFPEILSRAALRFPLVGALTRVPFDFLESINHMAFYNCQNTLSLLRPTGLFCPPFDSYVDNLVRHVRDVQKQRRQKVEQEAVDPFD